MVIRTDTIAAIATSPGDSGIGVIRVSGGQAIELVDSIFSTKQGKKILLNAESHTIHYGYIMDQDLQIDEVLVSVFRAPRSYTMEDTVEINCHGGGLIVQRVLQTVLKAGARLAEPGEFTKRAFLNGRIDLSEAEAVMDLIHSKNELSRKASLGQLRGDLSDQIKSLREEILYEIAFIESALDDPEHISLENYPERLKGKLDEIIHKLKHLSATCENGRIIKEGISTVIVGKPNAGKSSLLNMILGQDRAIVTDIAGTTRDILEEAFRMKDIHLNIVDTAGIRDTQDIVEKIGVDRAKQYAKDADLILYVVDSSVELDENDLEILSFIKDKKIIFIFNKSDLDEKVTEKELLKKYHSIICDSIFNKKTELEADSEESLYYNKIIEDDKIRIVHTSAAQHIGLSELEHALEELFLHGEIKNNDEIMITNIRHKEALEQALQSLSLVEKSIEDGMPEDFYTIDLMEAYASLGSILGEEVGDDLIEEIFSKFCMGK